MNKPSTAAAIIVLLLASVPVQAQTITSSMLGLYELTKSNIVATANLLDDEMYSYRPVPEVRSAGQILAHLADAQFLMCSASAGQENPAGETFEQTRTTRSSIVDALTAAFEYCDRVFAHTTDESGARPVAFVTGPNTALGILAFDAAHNFEHYGNLVTYMRLNGITPPSSR